MQATGNIQTETIRTEGINTDGGDISLTAGGNILTGRLSTLLSVGGSGKGGDITLNAGGTVTTSSLASIGYKGSGDITINAKNDITFNCIDPQSCIESFVNPIVGTATLISTDRSGNVSIISEQGAIIFQPNGIHINTGDGTYSGSPGSITLQAKRNISVDSIISGGTGGAQADGANINITSVNGSINIGEISATSLANIGSTTGGNSYIGGNLSISANENITIGNVSVYRTLMGGGKGGIINFTSTNGSIKTGDIKTNDSFPMPLSSFNTANGGSINIRAARDITTGNLNLKANQDGGPIALTSTAGSINTGAIDTTGASAAGNITIQANSGIKTPTTGTAIAGTSSNGNGSNVTLSTASGDINIGDVLVSGIRGGTLKFTNSNGNITTGQLLTSYDGSSPDIKSNTGGNVNLNAGGNITTSAIRAIGNQDGGSITFKSGGSIDTTAGIINAMGGNNGGNISLEAGTNINTAGIGAILSSGFNANSGNLRIQSGGNINTTAGPIITAAANGKGGDVTINAGGTVSISDINSRTLAPSITVKGGNIDVQAKDSITARGKIETNRNNITFNAPVTLGNDLSVKILETGDITFKSTVDGPYSLTVQPNAGIVQLGGAVGSVSRLNSVNIQNDIPESSGAINIFTTNNITAKNITSTAGISLDSDKGEITTKNLDATSPNNGGNIALSAGTNIAAGDINTSSAGNGGSILLDATGSINVGKIDSSAEGNAGNVTAYNRSTSGNITVNQINAQSLGSGIGGNVEIVMEKFFRSLTSFTDRNEINASISTAGNPGDSNGGKIVIRHGGAGLTPFIVGDSATNGTAGAITRGKSNPIQTILQDNSYLYTHKQDGDRIQINSVPNPTPAPTPSPLFPPPLPVEPSPTPETSIAPSPNPESSIAPSANPQIFIPPAPIPETSIAPSATPDPSPAFGFDFQPPELPGFSSILPPRARPTQPSTPTTPNAAARIASRPPLPSVSQIASQPSKAPNLPLTAPLPSVTQPVALIQPAPASAIVPAPASAIVPAPAVSESQTPQQELAFLIGDLLGAKTSISQNAATKQLSP
jgi:hypothetical protein